MNENGQEASALMGTDDLRRQTAQIVSAHVSHNAIVSGDLPALIEQVYGALQGLGKSPEPVPVSLVPAVPIRKSVTPDWLICLEDGLKLKMLKRHLWASFGMTPDEYRERGASRATTPWSRRTMPSSEVPRPRPVASAPSATRPRCSLLSLPYRRKGPAAGNRPDGAVSSSGRGQDATALSWGRHGFGVKS